MADSKKSRDELNEQIESETDKRALRLLLEAVRRNVEDLPSIASDKEAQLKLGRVISEMKLKKRFD